MSVVKEDTPRMLSAPYALAGLPRKCFIRTRSLVDWWKSMVANLGHACYCWPVVSIASSERLATTGVGRCPTALLPIIWKMSLPLLLFCFLLYQIRLLLESISCGWYYAYPASASTEDPLSGGPSVWQWASTGHHCNLLHLLRWWQAQPTGIPSCL